MADDTVRARYSQGAKFGLMLLFLLALSVAQPFIFWQFELPLWQRLLLPVVTVTLSWWWALFRMVYRMTLTGSELRLRAALWSWRIPLAEVDRVGGAGGQNLVTVRRRDGKSWSALSGSGIVEFAERVAEAAPGARGADALVRTEDRMTRFFEKS
ncbi:hypothetical protein [Catenuloplanes atrovinosus]|uniref:PH domain-containing protein n=1 Tax=Catenuloplanes atrovinosus TaxID=137266 RepID=A0AAE4CCE8_9ACTN|nr:hypothetical protein [Catenuloplanes atrovinosus]MDR7277904.1 hypothetical protein [Catenuloplanes atrovinosus]